MQGHSFLIKVKKDIISRLPVDAQPPGKAQAWANGRHWIYAQALNMPCLIPKQIQAASNHVIYAYFLKWGNEDQGKF